MIYAEQCKACGKCIVACPKNILNKGTEINSYGFKFVICTNESMCIGCGNCFYSCPEPGAITIYVNDSIEDKKEKTNDGKRSKDTSKRK